MINKTKIYIAIALLLVAGACKKNQTVNNADRPVKTETHGMGAILDHDAFLHAPKVDIAAIKASLKANGITPKFELRVAGKQQVETINPNTTPPSSVVLLHPTPGDQGNTNTCVSWSLGYAAKQVLDLTWQSSTADAGQRSGWYIYNKLYATGLSGIGCSAGDLPPYSGNGLTSGSGLDCVKNYGVASATAQPSFAACSPAPTTAANTSAATDKVASYAAVTSYYDIKQLVAAGLPVYFAFRFYEDFRTAFNSGTTWSTLNSPSAGLGHAVCVIGYDDAKSAFLVQNSWGTIFGDSTYPGCVWVTYNVISTLLAQGGSTGGESYVMQPFSTTATHVYYNTAQSRGFTPSCSVGVGTGQAIYTVPANTYWSPVSVAAANAIAQNDINNNGQTYANSHGTCTPTTITVTLNRSTSISGTYSIQFSGAPGTYQKPFNPGTTTVTVPAGIYQVGIFPIGGSTASHSYSGSTCTMNYGSSGTSATFNNVLMNCGNPATFSIN
ncbi:DUF5977 domain-containing protein [Mucilaginibacter celer]|uniref:Peptidase C1A papain C-terminal domain-containing protein n=1 Tax=Mucilaginibacter celer TaxID=2305508 RepID=A0A494VMQ3_9SPHI|nr:DUF5977 domain-containing protein [Mucilaginibacter celer]AYL96617.1 hypothetical protein HYN43_015500 [Mucilaginibacter celer]